MKLPRRLLPAVLAFAWLLPAFGAGESGPRLRKAPALDTANARVIVKYRDGSSLMSIQSARSSAQPLHADTMGKRLGMVLTDGHVLGARTQSLRARGIGSAALAARLAAQPDVEWAVPAYRRFATAAPNDPLFGPGVTGTTPVAGQWYLRAPSSTLLAAIDAVTAWDRTLGDASVTVAVLDTGVRPDHPDLAGKLQPGHDFVSGTDNTPKDSDSDPSDPGDYNTTSECELSDSSWHGTQTAGLIGAATNNGIGMAGAGRNVMVLPVRVLGRCGGYDDDIIAGMRWAAGLAVSGVSGVTANAFPAKVLNMSLGSPGACTPPYVQVLSELANARVTVVAASGNEGEAVGTPANCPGALAVSGVRHEGTKVGYSNVGPQNFIAAPAGNCVNDPDQGLPCLYPILSTTNSGRTTPAGATYTDSFFPLALGTSFSSPLVAGVIGLMLSRDINLTPTQIRDVLKATARPFPTTSSTVPAVAACRPSSTGPQGSECYCTTSSCGVGLLDARAAVNAVGTGGVMPPLITINASNTAPARGTSVSLDASGTTFSGGRSAFSYSWAVTGGGSVGTLGAAGGASTTVLINTVGEVTVQLVVTDTGGNASTSSVTLYSQEAPADSGGGGAMSTLWNALVGLAVAVLAWQRRRPARG